MKKAFTLIEIIFVIVIMSIITLISSDLLLNVYKNYIRTRSINELEYKTDIVLEQISRRLANRLKGSEIARDTKSDKIFSIKDDTAKSEEKYALEWISKSYETQNLTYKNGNIIEKVGWSGIADINLMKSIDKNDKTTLTSPGSKFDNNFKNVIKNAYSENFGIFFITPQKLDIQNDFGYNKDARHDKIALSSINDIVNYNNITITVPKNMQQVSDMYYLLNTAYAIVPSGVKDYSEKTNNKEKEDVFDLYLYYDYQPWRGGNYKNGKKTLIAQDVSLFRFTQTQNGVIVMKLCVRTLDTNEIDLTICKTKAVY